MTTRILGLISIGCLISLAACSFAYHTNYKTDRTMSDELLPTVISKGSVAIKTVPHPITEKHNFCTKGLGPITVKYEDMIAYAKKSMEDILRRNYIVVEDEDQAEKTLTIAGANAYCVSHVTSLFMGVEIDIIPGQQPSRRFSSEGKTTAAHQLSDRMTEATLNAVREMFLDEEIKAYLEE